MIYSAVDLAAIRRRAEQCDDEIRARRGQPPRPTRCRSCATILTLLTHIALLEQRSSVNAPEQTENAA